MICREAELIRLPAFFSLMRIGFGTVEYETKRTIPRAVSFKTGAKM